MFNKKTKVLTVYDGAVELQNLVPNTLVYTWNPETKLAEVTKFIKSYKTVTVEATSVLFDSGLEILGDSWAEILAFRGYPIKLKTLLPDQSIRAFSASLHRGDGHWRVHGWVNGKAKHGYLARLIWEYYNGKIEGDLILHHKDFNKTNNRLDNLELLTNSQHSTIHWEYRGFKTEFISAKNHKITRVINSIGDEMEFYIPLLDTCGTFIIPDEKPVSGDISGIVAKGLLRDADQ